MIAFHLAILSYADIQTLYRRREEAGGRTRDRWAIMSWSPLARYSSRSSAHSGSRSAASPFSSLISDPMLSASMPPDSYKTAQRTCTSRAHEFELDRNSRGYGILSAHEATTETTTLRIYSSRAFQKYMICHTRSGAFSGCTITPVCWPPKPVASARFLGTRQRALATDGSSGLPGSLIYLAI